MHRLPGYITAHAAECLHACCSAHVLLLPLVLACAQSLVVATRAELKCCCR
jgi:hypothetical protein